MTAKSIITIDVNDAAFKRFKSLYDQYDQKLKTTPLVWKGISKTIDGSLDSFKELVSEQAKEIQQGKIMEEAHKTALRLLQEQETVWQKISRHTTGATTNFKEMITGGTGALKIFGGLAGGAAATFAAMAGTASWVTPDRKRASGMGVSIGEMKAADIRYERFFDNPGETLNAIANASGASPTGYALSSFGINGYDKSSPAQKQAQLLRKIWDIAHVKQNEPNFNTIAELDQYKELGISAGTLRRFSKMGASERDEAISAAEKLGGSLDPKNQKAWNDFTTHLEETSGLLKTLTADALEPLLKVMNPLLVGLDRLVEWTKEKFHLATDEKTASAYVKALGNTASPSASAPGFWASLDPRKSIYTASLGGYGPMESGISGADLGPRVKSGSGVASPQMSSLAEMLQGRVSGLGVVTAFADDYHKGWNSAHNDGRAADFRVSGDGNAVAREIRDILREMNINAKVIYETHGRHTTAPHIHVEVVKTPGSDVHVTGSMLGPVGGT